MTKKVKTIKINKPLWESNNKICVGIYDKKVLEAINDNQMLMVECKGFKKLYSPKWIIENGKSINKEFKIPGTPMKLYLIYIDKETEEEKIIKYVL